jgi:hypothetical protein
MAHAVFCGEGRVVSGATIPDESFPDRNSNADYRHQYGPETMVWTCGCVRSALGTVIRGKRGMIRIVSRPGWPLEHCYEVFVSMCSVSGIGGCRHGMWHLGAHEGAVCSVGERKHGKKTTSRWRVF